MHFSRAGRSLLFACGAIAATDLRRSSERNPIVWTDGTVPVTASFGVTEIVRGELDPMAVVDRSDGALYRSKQGGRNLVHGGRTAAGSA